MKYEPKFPQCPYRASSTRKCSHKACPGRCPYLKPEKCEYYNEVIKNNIMDSEAVSADLEAIGVLTYGL